MFSNKGVLTIGTAAEQSVHPTSGILRNLRAFFSASGLYSPQGESTPAHLRVTQTVGQPLFDKKLIYKSSIKIR